MPDAAASQFETHLRTEFRTAAGRDGRMARSCYVPKNVETPLVPEMPAFVLTPDTVWNPSAFDFRTAPRKILDRIAILPRREAGAGVVFRVILENQLLRYTTALLPFVLAMVIWPDLALPISQAPLPMLLVIGVVELKVLRMSKEKRQKLVSDDDAARMLDTLAFRGRTILSKIAAKHPDLGGELFLVVDQSELANVPPLSILSVQLSEGDRRLMPLQAEDRALLRDTLFDEVFTEQALHRVNMRDNAFLRSVAFNTRGVTAHARLAAILDTPAAERAPA